MDAHTALNSEYIIDGNRMDSTPAAMLEECSSALKKGRRPAASQPSGVIHDETLDRTAKCSGYDKCRIAEYAAAIGNQTGLPRAFEPSYARQHSRQRVAKALLDAIWTDGSFTLDRLELKLEWIWDSKRIGAMAAFYESVAAVSDYIYDLDCSVAEYSFNDTAADGNPCRLEATVSGCGGKRLCPEKLSDSSNSVLADSEKLSDSSNSGSEKGGDNSDWIIYIPFDTCAFRLGASLLALSEGGNGDPAPETGDPDWFIDCYEVVRELVEDGIITAGVTVCDGGLQAAFGRMCDNARFNVSGISSSYNENDTMRILFSEVPGVLIRIRDIDFDYVDSQLLLQDIAYYPLGHPCDEGGISVTDHSPGTLERILGSLISQAGEGED